MTPEQKKTQEYEKFWRTRGWHRLVRFNRGQLEYPWAYTMLADLCVESQQVDMFVAGLFV